MQKLINIIDNFKGKKIGVIGDLMLDQFIFGGVERISPEAPVSVVLFDKETYVLGGAANVANNIASLGGNIFLVGLAGKDTAGEHLFLQLKASGISSKDIVALKDRKTTQKIRVVAHGQHIVRIDKEQADLIGKEAEKRVMKAINGNIEKCDIIVISDYSKGVISKNVVSRVITLAKKHKKQIIADIKPEHAPYFKNIFLLTPNKKEALQISKTKDIKTAGKVIQKKMLCNVLITQGPEGMTLFENDTVHNFPAKAKEVFDVSGAGDTVLAVLSLALSSGANLKEAAIIANHAAGIAVAKVGTAVVLPEELKKDLRVL